VVTKTLSAIADHFVDRRSHPAEEWLLVAVLLSATGGYLDAFTWLMHGVLATVQSANVMLFGVQAVAGHWDQAFDHIPPIFACVVGVFVAHYIRMRAPERSRRLSLIIEIILLFLVMRLHMRVPAMAGTLGISFAAAVQNTCFTRVEGWPFSSVMVTRNLQVMSEGVIGALSGSQPKASRQAQVFATLCVAFGIGAAAGAFFTTTIGGAALIVPIILVSLALVVCEFGGRYRAQAV
jgi:uncharacterized membrane protein YoaK (UPF0700 family)